MIGKIFFSSKFLEGKARFSLDFFIVYKLLHLFDWEGLIFRNPLLHFLYFFPFIELTIYVFFATKSKELDFKVKIIIKRA